MLPLPLVASSPSNQDTAGAGRSLLLAALAAATSPTKSAAAVAGSFARRKPALTLGELEGDAECGTCFAHEDVEKEEAGEQRAAGWALLRSAFGWNLNSDPKDVVAGTPGAQARGRAFELMDEVEAGVAKETSTDFTTPLRRSGKLWRFRVIRSEDRLSARLVGEDGEFLLYAQVFLELGQVGFFLYDPASQEDRKCFDVKVPAFTMSFNEERTEWHLVSERCEYCQLSPSHLSCSRRGKQQLAHIRHARCQVGEGVSNTMEVRIPGIYSDGRALVWCSAMWRGDLGQVADGGGHETQLLITRLPVWNEEVESLVLDFRGRNIQASAKNFHLALSQKQKHTICQFGKLSDTNFALDFKFPMSAIQAFAAAMSTLFWI